ncbi:MAG: hypothetical protein ACI97A_002332 [Planctomycetota bacterium]|jgi:hypothetical protein
MNNNEYEMNDERFKLLIQRELDGEIRPEEEAELQQARGENEKFAALYAEEQKFAALLARDRNALEVPDGLAKSIGDQILSSETSKTGGRRFDLLSYLKPLSIAASFLILIGAAFFVGRQSAQADSDVSGAGLLREKQLLLEKHPKLDASEVEKVYEECVQALKQIGNDAETRRSEAYRQLENQIEKQILRGQHKGSESK